MVNTTIQIKDTDTGIPYTVRAVAHGERYGRDMCLTNDNHRVLIEFYDARYPFDSDLGGNILGQFVSRYYASTLRQHVDQYGEMTGLCLDTGVPDWHLSRETMVYVQGFIAAHI